MAGPAGISVREVPGADGHALADARGMTLYAFDRKSGGEACCAGEPCVRRWLHLASCVRNLG